MNGETNSDNFKFSCISLGVVLIFSLVISMAVYFFIPGSSKSSKKNPLVLPDQTDSISISLTDSDNEKDSSYQNYIEEVAFDRANSNVSDDGLYYFRQTMSRDAVEWFYFQITGNRDVARAILLEADKNDIPVSLAFALAFTESGFNVKAVNNNNSNSSIDRGLFQLNSNTFPKLSEADFFDPYTSARHGIAHLKFCLSCGGNEISALAMYNAGTTRVRSNSTPQTTLNYIGKIISYKNMLDKLFAEEVVAYYETQIYPGYSVAFANK